MEKLFASESEEWKNIYYRWVNLCFSEEVDGARDTIDEINQALSSARDIEGISFGSLQNLGVFTVNDLKARYEDLVAFSETIHARVEAEIDEPFCYGMSKVADNAFSVNPNEITVSSVAAGGAQIPILDLLSPVAVGLDKSLKKAFDKSVKAIGKLEPSRSLKNAIIDVITRHNANENVTTIDSADILLLVKYYEMLFPENGKIMDDFLAPLIQNHSADILNIKFIAYTAEEPYRTIMFHYLPELSIADCDWQGTQHYNPVDNLDTGHSAKSIAINLRKGKNDPRGPYFVFFHEIGHGVDDMMRKDGYFYSRTSGLQVIAEKDVSNSIDKVLEDMGIFGHNYDAIRYSVMNNDTSNLTPYQNQRFQNFKTNYENYLLDQNGSSATNEVITDIYGGFTNNTLRLNSFGHDNDYWTSKGGVNPQSSELFAGYFATNMTGYQSHVEAIDTFLPESKQYIDDEMAIIAAKF